MIHAKNNYETYYKIFHIFYKYADIFPYMRKDYLEECLEKQKVIYENGLVIIYHKYLVSKKFGNYKVNKGDVIIKDMVKENDKVNSVKIMNKFFDYVNTNVWCTVRSDNIRACKFYEKIGMKKVSEISWSKGKLKGYVYLKIHNLTNIKNMLQC